MSLRARRRLDLGQLGDILHDDASGERRQLFLAERFVFQQLPGGLVEQRPIWFQDALSQDEQVDLVALTWLGRDGTTAADWPEMRCEAARAHNTRTASYLLGTPLLGDFLEEGLSMLGQSCEDFEFGPPVRFVLGTALNQRVPAMTAFRMVSRVRLPCA